MKFKLLNSEIYYKNFLECKKNLKISMAQAVADKLDEKGLMLSVAESLTGGMVTAKLVDISGISKNLHEGIVTYSNNSKMMRLGVKEQTLVDHGAVSAETASEMANGLINQFCDIAVSTTGIAGPTGGTAEKPVGLVYFGLATRENVYNVKQVFKGNRAEIRNEATDFALYLLFYIMN